MDIKADMVLHFFSRRDLNCFNCLGVAHIKKTCLFKYTENFITKKKNEHFQIKNSDIFHISPQNIDCGYSLEPPRRGGFNEYP